MLVPAPETWPPRPFAEEYARRQKNYIRLQRHPELWAGAHLFYKDNPVVWIRDWCVTYDPRNAGTNVPPVMPLVPFKRQREFVDFIYACLFGKASGLIEKSRDMGATWLASAISVHLWRYWDGSSVGWGSRKAALVDKLGDSDSIFEKMRMILRTLPREMLPRGFSFQDHVNLMRIVNPDTGATITGEAGDDIGRGGRKLIYFKDESAHYEHPESIEASLEDNALVKIDMSSVNGIGNVFHRKRESGVDWSPGKPVVTDKTNVFVLDWRDHPGKTQAWYDNRKAKQVGEGLGRLFAQEVDRDYAASVEGTIIPPAWVRSALDAHKVLGLKITGRWSAALDVADGGTDTNALSERQGIVLMYVQEWGDQDTGVTTRRAVDAVNVHEKLPLHLQYDCVGVGSGIKGEYNRLERERYPDGQPRIRRGLRFVPWNGGFGVMYPERRVIPGDTDSPKNEDLFANMKAQAWWALRRRFEVTHRAVQKTLRGKIQQAAAQIGAQIGRTVSEDYPDADFTWKEEDLISINTETIESGILWRLVKELSQPTMEKRVGTLKMLVEKAPEGTKSPNLADSVVMNYFPVTIAMPTISDAFLRRI